MLADNTHPNTILGVTRGSVKWLHGQRRHTRRKRHLVTEEVIRTGSDGVVFSIEAQQHRGRAGGTARWEAEVDRCEDATCGGQVGALDVGTAVGSRVGPLRDRTTCVW